MSLLNKIKQLLQEPATTTKPAHTIELASAVLLVEIMRADHQIDDVERQSICQSLSNTLGLSSDEAETLLEEALITAHSANDLYQFTEVIHQSCDNAAKFELLKGLWKVAFSDQQLDKYEEHLIRRIAELLYVSHSEFIRAKIAARDGQ